MHFPTNSTNLTRVMCSQLQVNSTGSHVYKLHYICVPYFELVGQTNLELMLWCQSQRSPMFRWQLKLQTKVCFVQINLYFVVVAVVAVAVVQTKMYQLRLEQIPFRQRKLPESFFHEPKSSRPGHMKQGSNDSTGFPGQMNPGMGAHMRAHSSPATLQQSLSAVPQPPSHARQRSCDALLDPIESEPLPPGWEMAKTQDGQRYYLK